MRSTLHVGTSMTKQARWFATGLAVAAAVVLAGCSGGGDTASAGGGGSGTGSAAPLSARAAANATAGAVPLTVSFSATGSSGAIAEYGWNFRDNSAIVAGMSVTHTFTEPGMYDVMLTVRDSAGATRTANVMITATGTSAGNPNGGTSAACATAPAAFVSTVGPAIQQTCVNCHKATGAASGTQLVFVLGGTDVQNYNALRSYAIRDSDKLLAKSIGQQMHGGGAPFVNANDARYQALAALVPVMKDACGGTVAVASPFWNGVTFNDSRTTLAKASMLFASRNPTDAELQAVAAGGMPALRSTIRGYMQGAAFDSFVEEVGVTHLLSPGVVVFGNNTGLNATDFPSAADLINNTNGFNGQVRTRFEQSVRREGVELMKYIVRNDQRWTDMVAGNYTVMNGVMAQYVAASVEGNFVNTADDNEWRRAQWRSERLGGIREHAGVLSTHAWLQRFPTTDTNRNRHRVYMMGQQFLATDFTALAARPLDDGNTRFRVTWMENPDCKVCHDTIDPMAAGFRNWNEANRYLPLRDAQGVDHGLPQTYRAGNYPRDANNQPFYQVGDTWFRDAMPPGYNGTAMPGGYRANPTALAWLGQQVANDPRYAMGAVHFWYQGVFGRKPLSTPLDSSSPQYAGLLAAYNAQLDELQGIAARFATDRGNGPFNVRDLLVDLVMSGWFRAERATGATGMRAVELVDVGSANMLTPAHLNRKLQALTGVTYPGFANPFQGEGLNYGNFNGVDRLTRAKEHTMVQTTTADRVAASLGCGIVQADFNRATASRLLFPRVALADTPMSNATAIRENIRHMHRWMLNEDLAATDPEIQRTYDLYMAIWNDRATAPAIATTCGLNNTNDPNYTGRAWAAIVAYMIGDPKFLFLQ